MARTFPFTARAAPAALLFCLQGCAAAQSGPTESMPAMPDMAPSCGAELLDAYIGQPATETVLANIRSWRGEHPVRVLRPGTVVTMDYRPDRLNVNVNERGIITGFRCT